MMDLLTRFLFEQLNIKGEIVQLTASYQAIRANHPYPKNIGMQLGEALAASVLLAAPLKTPGSLLLQLQGKGLVNLVLAQATQDLKIRGLVQYDAACSDEDLFTAGHLLLTIKPTHGQQYQGMVAVHQETISQALIHYFDQSEQLPTYVMLCADEKKAAGFLIQKLPSTDKSLSDEDWNRIQILAQTLTPAELLSLRAEEILFRLFHEETLRVFPASSIEFQCHCDREKMENAIKTMHYDEVVQIFDEHPYVSVTCEFCNREQRFSRGDIEILFENSKPTYH
jgi:molecular chaperone Hsp33